MDTAIEVLTRAFITLIQQIHDAQIPNDVKKKLYTIIRGVSQRMPLIPCLLIQTTLNYAMTGVLKGEANDKRKDV